MLWHAGSDSLKPAGVLCRACFPTSQGLSTTPNIVDECVAQHDPVRQAVIEIGFSQGEQSVRCVRLLVLVLAPVVLGWAVSPDPCRDSLQASAGQKRLGEFLEGLPVAVDAILQKLGRGCRITECIAYAGAHKVIE